MKEIKPPEKCPVCGVKDFDVQGMDTKMKWREGYCIVGCGAIFKFNRKGKVKIIGGALPIVYPF